MVWTKYGSLLLDSWTKSCLGSRADASSRRRLRGPGSSGESTPARRVSPAPSWRVSPPRRRSLPGLRPPTLGADRAFDSRRGARSRSRRRRRARLHAEPSPPAARRGSARGGQARDLREAAGARRRRRAAARRRRGRVGTSRGGARSSTATTRRCARRASGSRAGRPVRCASSTAPTSRTGSSDPTTPTGAWTSELGGASRAFADIGSHWCDLAEFVSGHRIARLSARLLTAVPERVSETGRHAFAAGARRRRGAARHDRGRRRRPVRDRRRRSRVGRRQPGLGRSQEPPLDRARRRRGGARLRPGASGGALVRAARGADDPSPRSRHAVAGRGPLRLPSRRSPAGVRGLLRRLRGRLLREPSTAVRPSEGMPTFADGLRAAQITDAVLTSSREEAVGRRGGSPLDSRAVAT